MEKKIVKVNNNLDQVQEFAIEEYEDHIVLKGFLTSDLENVVIPESIEGKPVTVIGDECFFLCKKIKNVSFPPTIQSIGVQAFAVCKRLEELILPDSVIEIGHHAFRDCTSLKKIILPKKLKRLELGMFSFCHLCEPEIVLPEELEVIGNNVFWCAGSFDLVIPDSVKEIGVGAFYWGPKPITKLPEDKVWYLWWPCGEKVNCSGTQGRITDIYNLENGCELYEVTCGTDIRCFVYPCDFIDNNFSFTDEETQKSFQKSIVREWNEEDKLKNAYEIKSAWEKGLIDPK